MKVLDLSPVVVKLGSTLLQILHERDFRCTTLQSFNQVVIIVQYTVSGCMRSASLDLLNPFNNEGQLCTSVRVVNLMPRSLPILGKMISMAATIPAQQTGHIQSKPISIDGVFWLIAGEPRLMIPAVSFGKDKFVLLFREAAREVLQRQLATDASFRDAKTLI
ncbi:hypothetical protein K503DRAFT_855410 [Rhizopogon vinicolor AM-OR11-026]|uniref:Uncharacterized protein n=1 Tax=Rhizopogon vinicolor AM-OR11-026 TaxID=1314800 RepID=A0A1B7N621_9AGAM|nr:hypothetical protein K503DRAFT_855410 [Rhizopogon vinicolor AM-OR11-026]